MTRCARDTQQANLHSVDVAPLLRSDVPGSRSAKQVQSGSIGCVSCLDPLVLTNVKHRISPQVSWQSCPFWCHLIPSVLQLKSCNAHTLFNTAYPDIAECLMPSLLDFSTQRNAPIHFGLQSQGESCWQSWRRSEEQQTEWRR